MCSIIDAGVISEVFGPDQTEVGIEFRKLIEENQTQLVLGGKLLEELKKNKNFKNWLPLGQAYGRVQLVESRGVEIETQKLRDSGSCDSNDHHIIALAQISGARLLFSNDKALHRDFGNRDLIAKPRGKILSTNEGSELKPHQRRMLRERRLCRQE